MDKMPKLRELAKKFEEELDLEGATVEVFNSKLDGTPRAKVYWRGISTDISTEAVDHIGIEEFRDALIAEYETRKGI